AERDIAGINMDQSDTGGIRPFAWIHIPVLRVVDVREDAPAQLVPVAAWVGKLLRDRADPALVGGARRGWQVHRPERQKSHRGSRSPTGGRRFLRQGRGTGGKLGRVVASCQRDGAPAAGSKPAPAGRRRAARLDRRTGWD